MALSHKSLESRAWLWVGAAACTSVCLWQIYKITRAGKCLNDLCSEDCSEDHRVKAPMKTQDISTEAQQPESSTHQQLETKAEEKMPDTLPSTQEMIRRRILSPNVITVTYASTTGTCESLAYSLLQALQAANPSELVILQCVAMDQVDWWDELLNNEASAFTTTDRPPVVFFLLPTWSEGTFPSSAASLQYALEELSTDWRIEPQFLKKHKLQFGVFGMGSTAYDATTFCKPAKTLVATLRNKLGAKFIGYLGAGDDSVGDFRQAFGDWQSKILPLVLDLKSSSIQQQSTNTKQLVKKIVRGTKPIAKNKAQEPTTCCSNDEPSSCDCTEHKESDQVVDFEEEKVANYEYDSDDSSSAYDSGDEYQIQDDKAAEVMDMEDLGGAMLESVSKVIKEMVTPKQAASLKKEGYKLIGTHSAVKLCRWTKHQLRGRGGCYKHTFYGITSYQCMEATPSLACANKCVFCWRHHKNPVGKEWRWKTDDPNFIVAEAIATHVQMIKEARGIPGVVPERYQEALTVKHCALSLVGEPIMYPRINELLMDLHSRQISTFLVTNGQHPHAIDTLVPVTQLYVSVDAPTEQSLIEIDRPLFSDAWDRLRHSLSTLKDRGQRTVARLTVVKGWNSSEIEGYAKLIALGKVSLVEVKGVTFCGKSDASNLNISNSPWHHEVVALTRNIQQFLEEMTKKGGPDAPPLYGLACEHKHSCSVLLARTDQFAVDDPVTGQRKWRTWIDYPKYHELVMKYAADPTFRFGVTDYVADTPEWAVFGATEAGFDPTDTRQYRRGKQPLYTKFDQRGVPTHDRYSKPLSVDVRTKLSQEMDEMLAKLGDGDSITEEKGGEKRIYNASNMFRGLTVGKEE